jgi:alkanesulfonate monooxygenase SsuD/methylene tetrahydromethanopterin reductase-like flavin-dependent oxidoreductase (luciferase family)
MADKAGFGGYHLAEHQGSELCMAPGQELFIAAASQVTSDIKLGTMVKLLPIHRPVRLIEDMCTVDQLTDGRLEYGVGRGGSRSSTTGSARTGGSPRPVHRCAGDHQARVQRRRNLQRAQPFYDFPTMPLSTKPLQE